MSAWKFADSNFVYGRVESVDRDLYELTFKRQRSAGAPRTRTLVQAGTIGYVRDPPLLSGAETGVGGDLGAYRFNSRLDPVCGRHPVSFHVFFRIRFSAPKMNHGGHMQMAGGC